MTTILEPPEAAPMREFDLHYTGNVVELTGAVPADILAQALDGLQRLVYLLAMRFEGRSLNKRARPTADIQKRFPVLCMPPRKGSYVSPTMIGYADSMWLDADEADKIAAQLVDLLKAANTGDPNVLDRAMPDPSYQRVMLAALNDLVPPAGSGIELGIQQRGADILFASRARQALVRPRDDDRSQALGVVAGYLFDMDFAQRRFGLHHPPTERKLTCSYEPGGESMLLDHPMDLIQIIGVVERDDQGNIVRVVRVDEVLEIDTSAYILDGLTYEGRWIPSVSPILISPSFDAEEQLFSASVEAFGIEAYGETRQLLQIAIEDELHMLWREYALAADDSLAYDALVLKEQLQSTFPGEE